MASTREIINDLRAQAHHVAHKGFMDDYRHQLSRSMTRGADELERLLDELNLLRAYAEIPQEVE